MSVIDPFARSAEGVLGVLEGGRTGMLANRLIGIGSIAMVLFITGIFTWAVVTGRQMELLATAAPALMLGALVGFVGLAILTLRKPGG